MGTAIRHGVTASEGLDCKKRLGKMMRRGPRRRFETRAPLGRRLFSAGKTFARSGRHGVDGHPRQVFRCVQKNSHYLRGRANYSCQRHPEGVNKTNKQTVKFRDFPRLRPRMTFRRSRASSAALSVRRPAAVASRQVEVRSPRWRANDARVPMCSAPGKIRHCP